jgi:hypothetical protein
MHHSRDEVKLVSNVRRGSILRETVGYTFLCADPSSYLGSEAYDRACTEYAYNVLTQTFLTAR